MQGHAELKPEFDFNWHERSAFQLVGVEAVDWQQRCGIKGSAHGTLGFKGAHESSKIDLKIDFFHENSLGNNI